MTDGAEGLPCRCHARLLTAETPHGVFPGPIAGRHRLSALPSFLPQPRAPHCRAESRNRTGFGDGIMARSRHGTRLDCLAMSSRPTCRGGLGMSRAAYPGVAGRPAAIAAPGRLRGLVACRLGTPASVLPVRGETARDPTGASVAHRRRDGRGELFNILHSARTRQVRGTLDPVHRSRGRRLRPRPLHLARNSKASSQHCYIRPNRTWRGVVARRTPLGP